MTIISRKIFLLFLFLLVSVAARALTAGFTADYISGCSPLVVHFTNTSSGATSYYWDLGNGTTSTLTDVSGSYITAGTYTVTLTASNGSSTSVFHMTITVYPSPIVSFVATDTSICPGTSTTFTSTSVLGTSGAGTYLWNFGDGSSSTAASPTHTYVTPGFYNVTLVVTNSEGCASSLTVGAFIHVFNHSTPSFTASTTYFCNPPGDATFTSTTTGAGPFTCVWYFGDGTTGTGSPVTHTYGSTGSYTVKLIVTDANGCIDSITRTSFITITTIAASFTSATTVCDDSWVAFDNTSSTHSGSAWSFGDGGSSSSDTASHYYSSPGTYNVRLIISEGPCGDTAYETVTVRTPPTISFSYSPDASCPAPATVSFTGSVPSGSSVTWTFGDGATGSGTAVSHTYTTNGVYTVTMTVVDAYGCTTVYSDTYVVHDLILNIISDVIGGCVPLTVHFHDSVSTSVPRSGTYPYSTASYSWDFGDGSATSTAATPSHTYTATGVYSVVLNITTANGCSATDTILITVGSVPVITVTDTPSEICFGRSFEFIVTVLSGGPVNSYYWNWGDGTSSTDTFATNSHAFARPGRDTVEIIAYNNGCPSAPFYLYNLITDSPMAIISSAYTCDPYNSVIFVDRSLGDDTHTWLFGDGTTSTADSVAHTYPGFSTYTCTLVTYNARSGCHDTTSVPLNLIPPVLHMYASDSVICAGSVIHFTDSVTGSSSRGFWWYANGIGVDLDTNSSFYDTFKVAGLYTIKMVILDQHGCFDTLVHTNWISVAKPADTFVAAPPTGCWPLTVAFTDSSTDISGVSITRYQWIFGDGSTSTVSSIHTSHTYTAAGTYNVEEIVTDSRGCKDTMLRRSLITVSRPHAVFRASTQYPCLGNPVIFTNSSTGIVGSYWMFGDGDTSTTTSPTHIYTDTGTYTVKLAVVDASGCRDTAIYTSYIIVTRPIAAFTMSDSFTICPPLTVSFFNYSSGATGYSWTFGDGTTSILVSPSNLYVTSGLYHARLVVVNAHGCRDTATHDVVLYGYAGAFSYSPLTGCSPLTVYFNAAISNVPNIIWDFADGNTTRASMLDTTSHTYTLPGAYVPKLILSDNTGCRNSSLGLDTIKVDAVIPGFTTRPHPVCVNTSINFQDTSFSYFSHITNWHWVFTNGDTSDLSAPPYFYNTIGTYPVTLYVTDGWGCTGSVKDTITVYPPPTITASPDTIICVHDSGTLKGYGGVSYTWSPTTSLGCPTCPVTSAFPSVNTTYTVTGTDIHGCVNTDTVQVDLRIYTVSKGWGDTEVCRNVPVTLHDTGGTKYNWIPATGLSDPHIFDPVATPPSTTLYMIIAQYGSCVPDTNYVKLIIDSLPTVNAGPDQSLVAGSEATLNATGTLINKYLWSPGQYLSCDSCATTIASLMSTTTYTITVTTNKGCTATDSVTIFLYCDKNQIFIPNSFTPNGDGQNDVFYPRGSGVSKINAFRIYNRWGEMLFERTNISINDVSNAWDGTYNGGLPRPDVYVYLVEAVCDTGEPIFIKGDVTIIR